MQSGWDYFVLLSEFFVAIVVVFVFVVVVVVVVVVVFGSLRKNTV